MRHITERIDKDISDFNADCVISFKEIIDGISTLKLNKNDGHFGISTDYLINACDELYIHVSTFFSAMVVHGIVLKIYWLAPWYPKGKTSTVLTRKITVGLH